MKVVKYLQCKTDSYDHLQNLQAGDENVDSLRNPDLQCPESVVGIHEGVDRVVHQGNNSAG